MQDEAVAGCGADQDFTLEAYMINLARRVLRWSEVYGLC